MKRRLLVTGSAAAVVLALVAGLSSTHAHTQGNIIPGTPKTTAAEYDKVFTENNNWGRWVKDDKLGTGNLITDAKRKQAAALVKTGITVSIAHDVSTEEAADNPSP